MEKFKLNLIVGFTVLIITVWLIWAHRVWDWTGYLLLLVAIGIITKSLFFREKKPAKLLEFCVKGLIVSYAAVAVIWFINLSIASPSYLAYLDSELLMNILVFNILPLSLLPVAVSVILYGLFRIKLKAWEMLLSSWCVSVFVVFAIYQVWWTLYVQPYLTEFYYSSIAGAIALVLGLVFVSFAIACVLTILYSILRKPKSELSPYTGQGTPLPIEEIESLLKENNIVRICSSALASMEAAMKKVVWAI